MTCGARCTVFSFAELLFSGRLKRIYMYVHVVCFRAFQLCLVCCTGVRVAFLWRLRMQLANLCGAVLSFVPCEVAERDVLRAELAGWEATAPAHASPPGVGPASACRQRISGPLGVGTRGPRRAQGDGARCTSHIALYVLVQGFGGEFPKFFFCLLVKGFSTDL